MYRPPPNPTQARKEEAQPASPGTIYAYSNDTKPVAAFHEGLHTPAHQRSLMTGKTGLITSMKFKNLRHETLAVTRTYWKEILAVLVLLLAFFFFKSERTELQRIVPMLRGADMPWVTAGIAITVLYILFQAAMYVYSFRAINVSLPWGQAVELFLKRNFLSVFLPAGGVSMLAYHPSSLRKTGLNRMQTHQASGLYMFAGLLSLFVVGLPVILYAIMGQKDLQNAWAALLLILAIIVAVYLLARSLRRKKAVYVFLEKKFPATIPFIDELFGANVHMGRFGGVLGFSAGVELTGMVHILVSMYALGAPVSIEAAAVGYIVSVVLMAASPFLRGLGAVELTLVYVLHTYGYEPVQALAITMLYRVFEFWLPLAAGLVSFALKGRQLFVRLAPAVLIFALGLMNIISVVTPPLAERLRMTRRFFPQDAIQASNLLVLFIGLALLVTSAYLIKGLRNAWYLAIVLSVISLVGNLTKALDYEEAAFAGGILVLLLLSGSQYRIRSSLKWLKLGITSVVTVFVSVCIFGFISFYFIDKRHFGIDFSWEQSLRHTARMFLLVSDDTLQPKSRFGHELVRLTRVLGFGAWGFLLFTLVRPYLVTPGSESSHRQKAKFLLKEYGSSSVDYFKICRDKLFFFSDLHDAFMAYRVANGFAVVLEEPVCAEEHKMDVIMEFEKHCRKMGLKPAFYRVDENSIPWFNRLRKRKLFIGQEAILDLGSFTLEGKDKKSLRNGLNSLRKKGFTTEVRLAPQDDSLLRELKAVSDEWLEAFDKKEQVFSQGMYDTEEIRTHDVVLVKDETGAVQAFLNVIPDFSPGECTYDLIRKKSEAPGGCMDALIVRLIEYARERNFQYLNLGLVPLTGDKTPETPAEQVVKFASERIRRFRHFHSLRDFKEKYATIWQNKYIVYEHDFDLLQLPAALNKVMQP